MVDINRYVVDDNTYELKNPDVTKDFKLICLNIDKESIIEIENHSILFVLSGALTIHNYERINLNCGIEELKITDKSSDSNQIKLDQYNCLFIIGNQKLKLIPELNVKCNIYIATNY